jgi:UPF0176 protein
VTAVASLYRFAPVRDVEALRERAQAECESRGLKGTVLIAPEGVNAMLAGDRSAVEGAISACFPGVEVKWSSANPGEAVFRRLRVRVRDEILTFDMPLGPQTPVARRADAAMWKELLDRPDVLVLDVRNSYESARGTFRGAMRTDTATFREFRDFAERELDASRDRRIAMFCTGGIRCEKASAHLLAEGFEEVWQLDGGILRYLADMADVEGENAFAGECFVFDERVALNAKLAPTSRAAEG